MASDILDTRPGCILAQMAATIASGIVANEATIQSLRQSCPSGYGPEDYQDMVMRGVASRALDIARAIVQQMEE